MTIALDAYTDRIENTQDKDTLKLLGFCILMDPSLSHDELHALARDLRSQMDHLLERDGKSN